MSKEINLLPLRRRRQLTRQFFELQLRRFATSLLLTMFVLTLSGVVAIFGLRVAAGIVGSEAREELDAAVVEYRAETRAILEQNAKISEMQRYHEERLVWSTFVPDLLSSLPGGVVVSELSGVREGKALSVVGVAPARSAVIVLEERLRGLSWIQTVEAPHSNLLERLQPEYQFKIRL